MKKILLSCSFALMLLCAASMAQAEALTWYYETNAMFKNMQFGNGTSNGMISYNPAQGPEFKWGDSATKHSGVKVDGNSGTIITDGEFQRGITVTHRNNSISAQYKTLVSGTIFTTVDLKLNASSPVLHSLDISMDFHFLETTNSGNYQNDIFFMTRGEIMSSVSQFQHEGETYYVYLHGELQELTGDYLRMAQQAYGAEVPLFGWTTLEGQTLQNAYNLSLLVSKTPPTPIPGTVLLFGAGMGGLAMLRRKMSKA